MPGDNGNTEQKQKTAEELASERLTRYQQDPAKFVEHAEIIACVIRTPQGPMIYVSGTQKELEVAWAQLNLKLMNALHRFELEAAARAEATKIQQPGAMTKFARGFMGRK